MVNLLIRKTYALYQKETEVIFTNAKVRWPYANSIYNNKQCKCYKCFGSINDLYEKLGE